MQILLVERSRTFKFIIITCLLGPGALHEVGVQHFLPPSQENVDALPWAGRNELLAKHNCIQERGCKGKSDAKVNLCRHCTSDFLSSKADLAMAFQFRPLWVDTAARSFSSCV
jgi:hypothetical protein